MKKLLSFQIMKQTFKSTWIWWLVSIFVIAINLFMFAAEAVDDGADILTVFAEEALAFNGVIFSTVLAILFANILFTSEVEKGTISVTLCTPISRSKILYSKLVVYLLMLVSIPLIVGGLGAIAASGEIFDNGKWWTIIALWVMYTLVISSISFVFGCWFCKSRYALSASIVILGGFFFLNMLAQMNNFSFLQYATLQTLFDMSAVVGGKSVLWQIIVLPMIALPLFVIGVVKFLRKDLML